MNRFLSTSVLVFIHLNLFSQIQLPYNQRFDVAEGAPWVHYSIKGTDNWEIGTPAGQYLKGAFSNPNCWVTNLKGNTDINSVMCLETPYFSFMDNKLYYMSFYHKFRCYASGGNIEYSIDSCKTWKLLEGNDIDKYFWYNTATISVLNNKQGWSGMNSMYYQSFQESKFNLGFLKGEKAVKFRFKYASNSDGYEGWAIDNFAIDTIFVNLIAENTADIHISQFFNSVKVNYSYRIEGFHSGYHPFKTKYYLSTDSILDIDDLEIDSSSVLMSNNKFNYDKQIFIPDSLHSGLYYILHQHSCSDFKESNLNDNLGYNILRIDSAFIDGYKDDFEKSKVEWDSKNSYWEYGTGNYFQIEGSHSGFKSWYINHLPVSGGDRTTHLLKSPYLNFSDSLENYMCFYYRIKNSEYKTINISLDLYKFGNDQNSYNKQSVKLSPPRIQDWDCHCEKLSYLKGHKNSRIDINFESYAHEGHHADLLNVDDIYIGHAKPDFSARNIMEWNTPTSIASDTLTLTIFNGGITATKECQNQFFWSSDSIFDQSDQLIATDILKSIPDTSIILKKIRINKPTTQIGTYYLFYKLDATNTNEEIWENNNFGSVKIVQQQVISLPYINNFENQQVGWRHYATFGKDNWQIQNAQNLSYSKLNELSNVWCTGNSLLFDSRIHLLTPMFDLTTLKNPVLEFDAFFEAYNMNMSYSIDGGISWQVLDRSNSSFKIWYESSSGSHSSDLLIEKLEKTFTRNSLFQGVDNNRTTRFILDISKLSNNKKIIFRFNLSTTLKNEGWEYTGKGVILDNFSIKEKNVDLSIPYKKRLMISSLSKSVKFDMNIYNTGNYISDSVNISYYLSKDTIIDDQDQILDQVIIPPISPDRYFYINRKLPVVGISNYNYLLYYIDSKNRINESNELNNKGFWDLSLNPIADFPYVNNYNDSIIDGWKPYCTESYYRLRTIVALNEPVYSNGKRSFEWFTDKLGFSASVNNLPIFYLESPVFDFSGQSNVYIGFNVYSLGTQDRYTEGANLEYSLDGGEKWTLLGVHRDPLGANWYNYYQAYQLNNEPCWNGNLTYFKTANYDCSSILANKKNVIFRFKYRGILDVYYGYGFRLDNFIVSPNKFAVDLVALKN